MCCGAGAAGQPRTGPTSPRQADHAAAQDSQQAQHQAESSGRQSAEDAEVEQWASALTRDVTSASNEQDVQRRAFNFLKACKQFIENREVMSADYMMPDACSQLCACDALGWCATKSDERVL